VNLNLTCLAAMTLAPPASARQDKPAAVNAQAVEGVVTVRAVDYEKRIVSTEGAQGNVITVVVPPEAQNLDQVTISGRNTEKEA
jgi:hypothetical protein